jgi:hypothetical protein
MRKPCSRIDIVELGSLDQCVNGSGAAAAFIGAGEGPVVATDPALAPACRLSLGKSESATSIN